MRATEASYATRKTKQAPTSTEPTALIVILVLSTPIFIGLDCCAAPPQKGKMKGGIGAVVQEATYDAPSLLLHSSITTGRVIHASAKRGREAELEKESKKKKVNKRVMQLSLSLSPSRSVVLNRLE